MELRAASRVTGVGCRKRIMKQVVLVVEDDAFIRMDAVDIFETAGYRVLEAENADLALMLLETHPEITVLFTDIEMPGSMDGMKLAAAVADRWPPVRIIVASGRVSPAAGELPPLAHFLSKPYQPSQVQRALAAFR